MDREFLQRNFDCVQQHLLKASAWERVKLLAVSKNSSMAVIQDAIELGWNCFGESRYQQAIQHFPSDNRSVRLDFIGNLQGNKVAKVLHFCDVIQSVSSMACLTKVLSSSATARRCQSFFLEVNPLLEASKHGFCSYLQLQQAVKFYLSQSSSIQLVGLMTIAAAGNERIARQSFASCRNWLEQLNKDFKLFGCNQLSMGMSEDYLWAIDEGSTMIRLGTALFREN